MGLTIYLKISHRITFGNRNTEHCYINSSSYFFDRDGMEDGVGLSDDLWHANKWGMKHLLSWDNRDTAGCSRLVSKPLAKLA
ncbi:hypothetical protein JTE90_012155 [Oedothorax gibbosus]|uniref:Uncharacterized protein n=1 Tax=Oedothorax gibbosus TaxID=931172 RepID=A0AAV6UM98_9ARAC|nr:hypothetical protein JTE90_012155 [Oedothorax gibbosus]